MYFDFLLLLFIVVDVLCECEILLILVGGLVFFVIFVNFVKVCIFMVLLFYSLGIDLFFFFLVGDFEVWL